MNGLSEQKKNCILLNAVDRGQSLLRINCLTLSNNCCAASIKMGDTNKKVQGGGKELLFSHAELSSKPANEVWMQFEAKILAHLASVYPDQVGWMLCDELDEKESFWGLSKVPEFKQ